MQQDALEKTEILFFLTNTPCPRLQKKIKAASKCANTSVIYWLRSNYSFETGLTDLALLLPIKGNFLNSNGIWRIVSFLIFIKNAIPLLFRAKKVKIIFIDYIDVLFFTRLFYRNRNIKLIYEVGDLINLQYGCHSQIVACFSSIEKFLMKKVTTLILPSPFFWSEYYKYIFTGNWMLMENLPEAKVWNNFVKKQCDEEYVVGFIGSIRYLKPLKCLFEAIKVMRSAGHNIRIIFAGTGPDEKELFLLAKDLDFVTFSGAYQYEKDAPRLYGMVDMIYSVYDSSIANVKIALPNRLYEAIICSLPIVVAKGTNLEKYVNAYEIGYAVDYLSIGEHVNVLESQMNNDQKAQAINKSLQKINKAAFMYDKYYDELKHLFSLH